MENTLNSYLTDMQMIAFYKRSSPAIFSAGQEHAQMQLSAYQADTNQECSPPAKNLTGGEHRTAFRGGPHALLP